MIERILPDFYRIEIPLPDSPLKSINSYLIKGEKRFLLVDTGLNRKECLDALHGNLKELEVDLNRTDLLLTHFHIDHSGLVAELATENSKIYCSAMDASILTSIMYNQKKRIDEHAGFYIANGFPEQKYRGMFAKNPGYSFNTEKKINFTPMDDGDILDVGKYSFRCILTPGHTPGHICLYEANNKILVSGDHVLFDISPNIVCYRELENSLKAYLASLEKISALSVDLVLPGHRNSSADLGKRINELKEHHQKRLTETLSVLQEGSKTAWDVASRLTWGLNVSSWERFPSMQKWFALGETIAHLKFLAADNRVEEMTDDGRIVYKVTASA